VSPTTNHAHAHKHLDIHRDTDTYKDRHRHTHTSITWPQRMLRHSDRQKRICFF